MRLFLATLQANELRRYALGRKIRKIYEVQKLFNCTKLWKLTNVFCAKTSKITIEIL